MRNSNHAIRKRYATRNRLAVNTLPAPAAASLRPVGTTIATSLLLADGAPVLHTSPQNTTQGVKKTTLEYRGSAATQDMGGHTILHVVSPRVHEGVAADTNDALPERVLHHRRRRNAFKEGLVSNFLSRRDIQQQSTEHDRDGIVERVVLQQRRCWRRRAQTIATT